MILHHVILDIEKNRLIPEEVKIAIKKIKENELLDKYVQKPIVFTYYENDSKISFEFDEYSLKFYNLKVWTMYFIFYVREVIYNIETDSFEVHGIDEDGFTVYGKTFDILIKNIEALFDRYQKGYQ